MAEGCQEQEAKSNQNHRDEIEEQAATDRQTSGKKGHANLIKEDKGMWRGLLQYAAHAPDVPAEGGQALLQVLAVTHICQHLVKKR